MVEPSDAPIAVDGTEPAHERIGVFGGTFDPVHVGHVCAAAETRAALALDRVLLVVAGDPWQKHGVVVASAADRLAMVRAACVGIDGVEASALEVERAGPSYTVDTLRALEGRRRELFLMVGADVPPRLDTWHEPGAISALATLVVVERAGELGGPPPGSGWRVERVPVTRVDAASSTLRTRLAAGGPVDGLVPPAVVRLIRERRLYTSA